MQIFISSDFSEVLRTNKLEIIEEFNQTIKELKEMNKTKIIDSEMIVEVANSNGTTFYAYNIKGCSSFYILFTILEKNKLIVLDIISLNSDNEIESFVYSEYTNDDSDLDD